MNGVAKDLSRYGVLATVAETSNDYGLLTTVGKWREHLRLRAIGLQAEAGRLALAALSARAAAEQVACAARGEDGDG